MYNLAIVGTTTQLLVVAALVLQIIFRHQSIDTKEDELTKDYDYIVVGSGAAGGIVAHRLAEDGHTRVLLLEAGGPSSLAHDIVGPASTHLHFFSQNDWNFTMDPQFVGRAFAGGVIAENRGFVLGGTTSTNTMIYNRGNSRDYDTWVKEYGAVGWSYADCMPYFLKFEGNRDPHIVNANPGFHSTTGPMEITSWATPDPLMILNQEALNKEAGIPTTDINGPIQVGTTLAQAWVDTRGVRSGVANVYLDPNPFPHNLHILTGALVTKIIIEGKTAVGVVFERKGYQNKMMVNKEVIISAGAINTPKLLMLSGIGPKDHLQQFNIPVIQDLPVGDNYANHAGIDFNFLIKPESLKLTNIASQLSTQQMYEWLVNKAGPLTQYYRSVTYFSTSNNPDKDWPNVSLETAVYQFPQNLSDFRFYSFGERADEWVKYQQNYLGRMFLFVHPIIQRVRSRGYVRLASIDPHIPPRVNPLYLTNKLDYEDEIEMIRAVLQFYEVSSMSKHLEPLTPIPGCKFCPNQRYVFECTPYIECAVEQILYTTYHGVGTCRMGAPERKDTVLDTHLKVKGISRLRVCDNSIIPLLPNANTNAVALMIGEKCSQIIKDNH